MSRPIELITTLEGEDAKRFLRNLKHPPKNKAWEQTVRRSKRFKIRL